MTISKKNKWIPLVIVAALLGAVLLLFSNGAESSSKTKDDLSEYQSQKEGEIAVFLEESRGVDEVSVKLCMDENGKITGAAVICQGGNDPAVQAQVTRLLSAALGLPTNKIQVSGKG